jgi:hypothetical protein
MADLDIVKSGYELQIYPSISQRIYLTDKKPYFFIEMYFFFNIEELSNCPRDWMIPVNDWLTISLMKTKRQVI